MPGDDPREWLRFAHEDLAVARLLAADAGTPGRIPCFHAQQAVEKALKAPLVADQVDFPHTHNLDALAALQSEPLRSQLIELDLAALRPFAVDSRCPADLAEVSGEEARAMVALAGEALSAVERYLPPESLPARP